MKGPDRTDGGVEMASAPSIIKCVLLSVGLGVTDRMLPVPDKYCNGGAIEFDDESGRRFKLIPGAGDMLSRPVGGFLSSLL